MKLTEQNLLPHLIDLFFGVLVRMVRYRSNCCEEFNIPHHELRLAVIFLGARLGGIGATMQLKVQITSPRRKKVSLVL